MKNRRKQQNTGIGCKALIPFLTDYACKTGELKPRQLDLVKKHLATCSVCTNTAKDIASAANILRSASRADKKMPDRLSADRHQRIIKTLYKSGD